MTMNNTEELAKRLVVQRLKVIPPNVKFIVGGQGAFTPNELIEEVEKGTEIGKETIEMHLDFIRKMPHLMDGA